MAFQEAVSHKELLVVSTVTKDNKPHSNIMVSLGLVDGKLLIGLCIQNITFENLLRDPTVCLVTSGDKGYFRIKGKVEMFESGKYFDLANSLSNPPMPKKALLVSLDEILDLDTGKVITL